MEEWQQKEKIKCALDFPYFCRKYILINHPTRGLVPFELYKFQETVVEEFSDHQFNIVSKFRQAGLTTVALLWALWRCMFKLDERIMVMSKTDREAVGISKIVKNAKEQLPDWLCSPMKNDNDHEKEFAETGSVMWFHSPQAARSKSLTYLIIDEAAFITNMEEHWKAMYPTLSAGGNCIVISTVNGVGNWYHKIYTQAQDKKNQFNIIDLDYKQHPEYNTDEWAAKMRANLGEKGWRQEILRSFLGSGDTYIPGLILADMTREAKPPIRKLFPEWDNFNQEDMTAEELANSGYERGALWIWREPEAGREYIISADPSEGIGEEGDFSAFHVFDQASLEQVGEFYSNVIPSHMFAQVIHQVGVYYNNALVAVENTMGPGMAVCNRLEHTLYYENLYYHSSNAGRERCGVAVNRTIRPVFLNSMQTCLMEKLVKVYSHRTVRELHTFSFNHQQNRAMAQAGHHDDLVISLAICFHVLDLLNREMPLGMESIPALAEGSFLGKGFQGEEFDRLKELLEDGRPVDDFANEEEDQFSEMLPRVMFGTKRPNDALLKEFSW